MLPCFLTVYFLQGSQRDFLKPVKSSSSSAQNLPMAPISLRVNAKVLAAGYWVLHTFSPATSWTSSLLPSLSLQLPWLSCLSLNIPGTPLPQDLCTCSFLCLEEFSCRQSNNALLPRFNQGSAQKSSYQKGLPRLPWSKITPSLSDTLSSLLCLIYLHSTYYHLLY